MYFIDLISRIPKENSLLIKGWAFEEKTGRPVSIKVETDEELKDLTIRREYNEGVNTTYGIKEEHDLAFLITIRLDRLKGKVRVIFGEGDDEEVLELNLNKRSCHPKEYDPVKDDIMSFLRQGKQFIKSGNGVRYVINKFRKQIPSLEDPVYNAWIDQNESKLTDSQIRDLLDQLEYKPLISILVPVYNVDLKWIQKMVESVLTQSYPNWELIMADDNSSDRELKHFLERMAEKDDRIKVVLREKNGGISEATNSAYELATGEYIGLLDNDDTLAPNALMENVIFLNENPDTDFIYSDEDKIDIEERRSEPYFKPDFSPDTILTNNYICHFLLFKKDLIGEEPLMRKEFDGAQDHDLILRLIEKTVPERIGHIPKILYHWRKLDTSTAQSADNKDYTVDNGARAIEDAIFRRGYKGEVVPTRFGGFYDVAYEVEGEPKVSIIIPTHNNPSDLNTCVRSILAKTFYSNYEIVIVDNNNDQPEALAMIDSLQNEFKHRIRVLRLPIPFNYSRINNLAAEFAEGDFYVFLNDDTKVITPGWIMKMLGYAQKPWIGCVGVKLLYPDDTIQHAGVIVGILGIAGHVFSHYPREIPGYFGRIQTNMNFTAVTAACLMIEKDKFWEVGGFDDDIAVAFNDVDLCCKVANAGYYNIYLGSVELYHYESKSRGYETTQDKMIRFDKEKGRIVRKWRKYILRDPMYNPNLSLLRGDYSIKV